MIDDLEVFKQYFQAAAKKIPAESFFYGTLEHKFRHSIDVWQIGQEILQQTPELAGADDTFKTLAERALLFHDVGRFEEAVRRYEDWRQNRLAAIAADQYDHGSIGYTLLKERPEYNDLRILLAVKYHGKMMEDVRQAELWQEAQEAPEGKAAQEILYLVRDADKLANLQVIKRDDHLRQDLFFKQLIPQALKAPLSEAVKEQFWRQETVLFTNVYSFADRVLMVLSWIFDLNYQYAREMFAAKEYDKYLLELLGEYHQNTAEIEEIGLAAERYLAALKSA